MAIDTRPPAFACDECGAATIEIPEWTDDQTVLSCQDCGKPIGKIRLLLAVLQAASVDNENEQPQEEVISAAPGSRRH
ncbi:hypothetical protein DK26_15235 [Bosea sp. WAO]|uniref:hypothetical protein n=1 Tax=Bosea sp. WAO TaxID=406341 RepID=UPI0007488A5B|nr:hypothetical protein [Bosea sp. WAO]KUL94358.1 hypothetical protein DK26_15235 [Bosea sp. WAO]